MEVRGELKTFTLALTIALTMAAGFPTSAGVTPDRGNQSLPNFQLNITSSLEMKLKFPFIRSGVDNEDSPVYIVPWGKWKFKEFVIQEGNYNGSEVFENYMDDNLRMLVEDGRRNGDQGVIFIIDWDGFAFANYANPKAMTLALGVLGKLGKLYDAMKCGYFLHTTFATSAFVNLAKPYLGNILEKIEILGTQREKWIPKLLAVIPRSQLPVAYGGDNRIASIQNK